MLCHFCQMLSTEVNGEQNQEPLTSQDIRILEPHKMEGETLTLTKQSHT